MTRYEEQDNERDKDGSNEKKEAIFICKHDAGNKLKEQERGGSARVVFLRGTQGEIVSCRVCGNLDCTS